MGGKKGNQHTETLMIPTVEITVTIHNLRLKKGGKLPAYLPAVSELHMRHVQCEWRHSRIESKGMKR